ncbi:hypothetical protein QP775_09700 [Paenibacillus sp. UMB4589-SE434]|nr:hypothetical protein [Paenibacillus sp. UMB4589-SE434]
MADMSFYMDGNVSGMDNTLDSLGHEDTSSELTRLVCVGSMITGASSKRCGMACPDQRFNRVCCNLGGSRNGL